MDWRKSSYSGANGGSCVEVAGVAPVVLVRDTKDRDDRTLTFSAEAWRAFALELKRRLAPQERTPSRAGASPDIGLTAASTLCASAVSPGISQRFLVKNIQHEMNL